MSENADPATSTALDAAAGGRLTIDLAALAANWREMAANSAPAEAAAVVKADAYGLGFANVVPTLHAEGCRTFFVALAEEGLAVRALAPEARIFVLNGYFAGSAPVYRAGRLIPVAGCREDVDAWLREAADAGSMPPPFALQVDTGMNRTGLSVSEALDHAAAMRDGRLPRPVLVMSHLACADTPSSPMNRRQYESFQQVRAAFEGIESSLANSAGVFLGADYRFDLTRPGIALYGGRAAAGIDPLRPVVTLEGRIASLRRARAGETVSYGATERLARDSLLATCAIGYADGFPRSASGSGVPLRAIGEAGAFGFVDGRRVPVVGRVTMDLTVFDVTDCTKAPEPGAFIEFFGPNIGLDDAAHAGGTIGYELLTGLSKRYRRRVVNG